MFSSRRQRADRFRDRSEAGQRLAAEIERHGLAKPGALVLALPRGGVPVGFEVADRLGLDLDSYGVRKLGVPGHEQLAMGAIATGETIVLEPGAQHRHGVDAATLERLIASERSLLDERDRRLRGERPPPSLAGRELILVDDGLATGATMRAAIRAARAERPRGVTVAVPVAPPETCERIAAEADAVVCLLVPSPFMAVGSWYADFQPVDERQAADLLRRAREGSRAVAGEPPEPPGAASG